jgi:hypothetical protein
MADVELLDELKSTIEFLNTKHGKAADDVSVIRATTDPDEYYTDYFLQWRVKK